MRVARDMRSYGARLEPWAGEPPPSLASTQQRQRPQQSLVVLRIGRDIGLRAALLGALPGKVAAQRGLALGLALRLRLVRHVLQHFDVRRDALGLDRAAQWREVTRRGEAQRALVAAERDDGLHRALAERARTDNGRALVVLQRAGDDLGRRRAAPVDQHDDRLALGEVAGIRIEVLRLLRGAAAGRDDLAALEERIRHRDRLSEQAARIVADVDDVAAQLVGRDLRLQLRQRLLQALGGLLVELGETDVADVVAVGTPAHGAHADDRAL